MSTPAIKNALEGRLKAWNEARPNRLPIQWQNVKFTVPAPTVTWLRATTIPGESGGGTLCAAGHRGIFQVDVFAANGDNAAAADMLAAEISALFYPLDLGVVKVSAPPTAMQGVDDKSGHYHLPVRIRYFS